MIETNGNISRDFNVLTLIVAHRYFGCVVQQDVCSLQGGVGEKACRDEVGFSLGGLIFELSHSAQFAETHRAFHDPSQL